MTHGRARTRQAPTGRGARRIGRSAAVGLLLVAAACGKKGPPLEPFPDIPRAVRSLSVRRLGQQVVIQFTVPDANIDNRQPADLARVDLYVSAAPVRRPADYLDRATPIASVIVRPPAPPPGAEEEPAGETGATPAEPVPGVNQGDATTVVLDAEQLDALIERELEDEPVAEPGASEAEEPRGGPVIRVFAGDGGPLMSPPPVPSVYVLAVGVNRRGRDGPPSDVVEVPLYDTPPVPGMPEVSYTEETLTVSWASPSHPRRPIQARDLAYTVLPSRPLPAPTRRPVQAPVPIGTNLPSRPLPSLPLRPIQSTVLEHEALASTPVASFVAATGYRLYEVDGPAGPELATGVPGPEPLDGTLEEPRYELSPVEFGARRCFVVRTREERNGIVLESEASPARCVTPVDTFAPAAPQNLSSVSSQGTISLIWDANGEADLAGYLVLRGEAPGETLQALTAAPIPETTYRDPTVASGVAYVYAVVAVDSAGNRSEPSNQVQERGR